MGHDFRWHFDFSGPEFFQNRCQSMGLADSSEARRCSDPPPAEWQQFFELALSPKTAVRPQSAKEFVSTLSKALAFVEKST